jgi:hypothetical protein
METKILYYALIQAYPASQPPFSIELGFGKGEKYELKECLHIPDGVEKIEKFCTEKAIKFSENFTLIYPIYLEIMDTDSESTMHSIAWLIKDQADARKWNFDRIGGYTGKTVDDFTK